jgi:phospholipid/cholesterol/gamma-HCH transport system substrate-binding protein
VIPQSLSASRLLVVTAFALTCFGLMLYLWNAFGGPVPLKPKGYRVTIALPEADLLSTEADVRISGVNVGRVVTTERTTSRTDPDRKDAILELDARYAPLRADVRATIRRKSLAGEEYLELTPGSPTAPAVPDGGRLGNAQVAPSVEIDEVLRTFDPATRRRVGEWLDAQSTSIDGRGPALNAAFGSLPGFEQDLTAVLTTLNRQSAAVRATVQNTGEVFDALSARRDDLRGLIVNGRRVTDVTERQHAAFADIWRAFPTFEAESRRLLQRAERFRRDADPVITQLRPGVRAFGEALQDAPGTAHELKGLTHAVDGASRAAVRGLPAAREFFDAVTPLVQQFGPFLDQFAPTIGYIGDNADSLTGLVGNLAATTQPTTSSYSGKTLLHYARALVQLNPATLARFPDHRLSTNRADAYPNGTPRFTANQPPTVLDAANCGSLDWPALGPADPSAQITEDLRDRILRFVFNDGRPVAPPCLLQKSPVFPRVEALSHTPGGTR